MEINPRNEARQALSDLLDRIAYLALNSRDAIPKSGEIVFKTTVLETDDPGESSLLVISVEDTGEGMDDEVLERVFEPFFTTKPPGKGTGMGLAAAYGAVASHHGRIEIASQKGVGTTASVVLPCSSDPTKLRVDTMAEKIALGVGTVVLIDDEDGVRSALTDLLESLGCLVVGFELAAAGASYYRENWRDVDLVILDLVLPDMTGREALEILREINPGVRVLLVSGYSADDELRQLLRSDAIEFLETVSARRSRRELDAVDGISLTEWILALAVGLALDAFAVFSRAGPAAGWIGLDLHCGWRFTSGCFSS